MRFGLSESRSGGEGRPGVDMRAVELGCPRWRFLDNPEAKIKFDESASHAPVKYTETFYTLWEMIALADDVGPITQDIMAERVWLCPGAAWNTVNRRWTRLLRFLRDNGLPFKKWEPNLCSLAGPTAHGITPLYTYADLNTVAPQGCKLQNPWWEEVAPQEHEPEPAVTEDVLLPLLPEDCEWRNVTTTERVKHMRTGKRGRPRKAQLLTRTLRLPVNVNTGQILNLAC